MRRHVGLHFALTMSFAGLCAAPVCAQQAAAADGEDRIWVGPKAFREGRTLRDDFLPMLTDPDAWPIVLSSAQVFKSYIMILPDVPVPGNEEPELGDAQMRGLAEFLNTRGLKVAFEVGGLRQGPEIPTAGWGERHAESELRWLRRWIRNGGRIDYLTTDHAVMHNIGAHYVHPDTARDCGMDLPQVLEELASYFVAVRRELPHVRLGVIESLGYFHVTGPDGREYPRTVRALPVRHFHEFLDALLQAMERHDLTLDHFHIDFGYEGVRHDGRAEGRLDFGRVRGVEMAAQQRGVKAGVIINAFHDRAVTDPDPATASREAYEHTMQFTEGYLAAGGTSEHLVIQTWQPYPHRTGPEDEPFTVLNTARDVLIRYLLPATGN